MHPNSDSVTPAGPLVGVKMLDFCSFINGAYSAAMMGDLGADVIKIEPLTGDLSRAWGPFLNGESRFYQVWNRNKRCIALDLTAQAARDIVYELVRGADVVIENFRTGVTEKLGIDYATLRDINPRLIYCSSTAFGSKGPERHRPGYDPVLQALSGIIRDNARFSGKAALLPVAVADYQASMLVITGVLAALYHRERTGAGQRIETSLLQAVLSVHPHYYVESLDCEEEGAVGIYPYRLFETEDDHIFVAAGTDKFWRLLCEVLGVPELGPHPLYDQNSKRTARGAELTALLQPIFKQKITAEWEQLLVAKGVPCGALNTYFEFLNDPQVTAMEMNPVLTHPAIGAMRVPGIPVHFANTPGAIQRPAPLLGQHTGEILGELGFDEAQIAKLRAEKSIA